MNALSLITATVEPGSTPTQELQVLRAACRRHGLPAPRVKPAGDNRYARVAKQNWVYVFGPHNIFELVPGHTDHDGTLLSYPCIPVLLDGNEEAAVIVVNQRQEALESVLNKLLTPRDPAGVARAISAAAGAGAGPALTEKIERAFQAHATVEPAPAAGRKYVQVFARAMSDLVVFRPRSPQIHGMHNAEAYLGHLKSHPLLAINVMRVPGVHSEARPTDVYAIMRIEKDVIARYWSHYGSVADCVRETKDRITGLIELLESNRGTSYADFRRAFHEFGRAHGMSDDLTGKSLWHAYCR